MTTAQFLFVSFIGLLRQLEINKDSSFSEKPFISLRRRVISLKLYLAYVSIFFTVSVLNNKALGYDIPMPFHMIFRSGSLVASLIMGFLILHKRYSIAQVLSVVVVSSGIFLATFASATEKQELTLADGSSGTAFAIGITMLTVALLLSATLGILQEYTYGKYPDVPRKALSAEHQCYSHCFSLPFFLPLLPSVIEKLQSWSTLNLVTIPGTEIQVSAMYFYILGNVITQYICITGVFMMTGAVDALTMTLTISLRKFVSLLLSIFFFRNPFTVRHWIATALVFGGTLLYSLSSKKKEAPKNGKNE